MEAVIRSLSLSTFVALGISVLTACGGGGGGSGSDDNGNNTSNNSDWIAGNFLPSETFANLCQVPRTGTDPDGRPWPDVAGSFLDEKNWLRSWSNDTYLWYNEIVDQDPSEFGDPVDYFDVLKTDAKTDSGKDKDEFHFWVPTEDWIAQSQSGVAVGYGFQWAIIAGRPPREILVAYSDGENSWPMDVSRGFKVLEADGVDVVNANTQAEVDKINDALFPAKTGDSHHFVLEYPDGTTDGVLLHSKAITMDPVQNVKVVEAAMQRKVGYMLFNDHIATAQDELKDAVAYLQSQNIDDLVLDLRYNGGGYLAIASQLAYMIAGSERTAGRVFETLQFNDKHTEFDVLGRPIQPTPFHDRTFVELGADISEPLPALGLSEVYVLAGPNTCSASEAIINGLRGVGVTVIQVGGTTCGKPYGFYPTDNCGVTYFTIQFKGVNEKGFGDYADGFSPANSGGAVLLPGCSVSDDFAHDLGDPQEARFAAALHYIENFSCPASPLMALGADGPTGGAVLARPEGRVRKNPWLQNRIMTQP